MLPARWRELAESVGLEYAPEGPYLFGDRDGYRVMCCARSGVEWDLYEITIPFRAPFDVLHGVAEVFDPAVIVEIDAAPTGAVARLVERAKVLLGDPPPASLTSLVGWRADMRVGDHRLLVTKRMDGCSPALLREIVRHAVELAGALEARRGALPVRAELARMEAPFRDAALALGLHFTPSPLRLQGSMGDVPVTVEMSSRAGEWKLVVAANFPEKPPLEVNIGPHVRTWLERLRLSAQGDVELGARELDDALEIQTDSPEDLRRRLSTVHASLHALVAAGQLSILENVALIADSVDAPIGDLLRHAAEVATAIATTRRSGGPFR
jgi:hypothetical protein